VKSVAELSIEPWDKVVAVFKPKRKETLRPELLEAIGATAEFRCSWIIDENDGGHYVGQGAFHTDDERFHHYWVPAEDLELVQAD
jgi:hypothetical protein